MTDLEQPKNILALDGGGVRGIVTIAFLEQIEALLKSNLNKGEDFRLCNYFDLIGGTSTGAIIASGLAMGKSVKEMKEFYFNLAPQIFKPSRRRILGFQAKFDANKLNEIIRKEIGDITLESDQLRTGLAIVAKRLDTGSAWVLSNNPNSKYWDDPADGSYIGNKHYPLANIIRASTAAPNYFAPEYIPVLQNGEQGLFIDGGISPHNNPSMQMLMLATISGYGYQWKIGEKDMSIINIGTGSFRNKIKSKSIGFLPSLVFAGRTLLGLMTDLGINVIAQMQWLGKSQDPWVINSEIGDLSNDLLTPEPLFAFQRYDLSLEQVWLKSNLNIDMPMNKLKDLRKLDSIETIEELYQLAKLAARKQIKSEHL